MAAIAASDVSEGPVLNLINKRIRNLRKKLNRIIQLEEAVAQGKPINKEQEDVIRSKPGVAAVIDELEKLRQPLYSAVQEELSVKVSPSVPVSDENDQKPYESEGSKVEDFGDAVVEDLLNLLYFGSMFDVKSQSDFTSTMLTRTHERGCCLTYDYVSDDATDMLGERDLDMISMLGGLLISRPVNSSLSHKNALQQCIERAKHWLSNSNQPVEPNATVTYAGLRERLRKIMASDYFTTTPEIKAPVDVAAAGAAGYTFQAPVESMVQPVQVEGSGSHYQQKDEDSANFQEHETGDNQSIPVQEFQKDELETENPGEAVPFQQEQVNAQAEVDYNQRDAESKDQQYLPRRSHQNQRGGRGSGGSGRRGYSNGRGARSGGRGGGGYQNGRSQYYEQPGNYYPRNYYNNRGRGGRGGGHSYNNNGSAVQGGQAPVDVA